MLDLYYRLEYYSKKYIKCFINWKYGNNFYFIKISEIFRSSNEQS